MITRRGARNLSNLCVWSAVALLAVSGGPAYAAANDLPQSAQRQDSLKLEIQRAIDKGLDWLIKNQAAEGYWSTPDHPALTALPLMAFLGDPSADTREASRSGAIERGYKYLLSCVHEDGIYGKKELVNYNTSVSLMALSAAGKPEHAEAIRKARKSIVAGQYDGGVKGQTDDPFDGGVGYGSSLPTPDVVNTMHALEALYYTRAHANPEKTGEADLNWQAAIKFLQNCQHLPGTNKQSWVSADPKNKGGFIYSPDQSKAGEMELEGGRTALRAYASISYAGMLSYIYAGLSPSDSRVKAVLEWLERNYTLEENPGMGQQGLYFYFHTMAKALSTAEVDALKTTDGKSHPWREELTLRLLDLQKPEGYWSNDNGRWWEKDPVLSTAYSLIALERIYRGL